MGIISNFFVQEWLKAWRYNWNKSYWELLFSQFTLQSIKENFWSSTFPSGEVCKNREAFISIMTLYDTK